MRRRGASCHFTSTPMYNVLQCVHHAQETASHLVRRGVDVDCDSCMLASNSADKHKFHHLEVDSLLAQKQLQTRLHDASTCTVEPH